MPTKEELENQLQALKQENNDLQAARKSVETELAEYKGKSKVSYLPKEKKFQTFDESVDDIVEWFEEIETYVDIKFTDRSEKIMFITDRLPRKIQRELKFLLDVNTCTVEQVKTHLCTVYGVQCNLTQLKEKFFARNQKPDEELMSYSHALVNLARLMEEHTKGSFGDKDSCLKQRMSEGVLNRELSRELHRLIKENTTQTFLDFRNAAIDWMSYDKKSKSKVVSSESVQSGKSLYSMLESQQGQLNVQKQQLDLLTSKLDAFMSDHKSSASGSSKDRYCSYCKKPGHVKEKCFVLKRTNSNQSSGAKSSKFCSYCKKSGHVVDTCFKKKKVSSESNETNQDSD